MKRLISTTFPITKIVLFLSMIALVSCKGKGVLSSNPQSGEKQYFKQESTPSKTEKTLILEKIQEIITDLKSVGIVWNEFWTPQPMELIKYKMDKKMMGEEYDPTEAIALISDLKTQLSLLYNIDPYMEGNDQLKNLSAFRINLNYSGIRIFLQESKTLYEHCQEASDHEESSRNSTLQVLRKSIGDELADCETLDLEVRRESLTLISLDQKLDFSVIKGLHFSPLRHLNIIRDQNLTSRSYLNSEGLTYLTQLESLKVQGFDLPSLDFISSFKNLKQLELSGSYLVGLTNLPVLPLLRRIVLRDANIIHLESLAPFKELKSLDLSNNKIKNVRPLAYLKNLKRILLKNNNIQDIKSLATMTQLEEVNLLGNPIKSLAPLSNIESIKSFQFEVVNASLPAEEEHCPTNGRSNLINAFCKKYLANEK